MEHGTTLLAMSSLLSFLAGSLPFATLLYLQQRLHNQREEQWTRIFSVHSLMIPKTSMDGEEPKPPTPKKPDLRQRVHVPLAVPDFAKDVYRSMKKGNAG